jgi:hypothetical protein
VSPCIALTLIAHGHACSEQEIDSVCAAPKREGHVRVRASIQKQRATEREPLPESQPTGTVFLSTHGYTRGFEILLSLSSGVVRPC